MREIRAVSTYNELGGARETACAQNVCPNLNPHTRLRFSRNAWPADARVCYIHIANFKKTLRFTPQKVCNRVFVCG